MTILAHSDAFRFTAAVLAPDGRLSSFSSDLNTLKDALKASAEAKTREKDLNTWSLHEQQAFLRLRALKGRHVIVRLFNTPNPYHIPGKDQYARDTSMETFASTDLAPIYRILAAPDTSLTIPGGDASTEPSIMGKDPDTLGIEQSQQMQAATTRQAEVWEARNSAYEMRAGED